MQVNKITEILDNEFSVIKTKEDLVAWANPHIQKSNQEFHNLNKKLNLKPDRRNSFRN